MTDTPDEGAPAHSMFKVLAALAELGEATAAAVAERAGLGYSTTTPKLRAWEESGQAERFRTGDARTLWRLTDAGRATTGAPRPDPQPESPAGPPSASEHDPAGDDSPPASTAAAPPADGDTTSQGQPDPQTPAEPAEGNSDTSTGTTVTPDSPDSDATPDGDRPVPARRSGGSLRAAVLDILEAHPDRQYRTGELCKLIDAANEGTGAAKASAGAVANAATKLVAAGHAVQTVDRPATYQLAPTSGGA
ncbi:single stranded DNA-binding domain-containing protein [Micromonospora fluostatini]|uniref:MarR family transcriptional regulator n=1 Tax=Micromonospora sp. JCM 30529 TaxID=3421643 RepID=UPI003D162AB4